MYMYQCNVETKGKQIRCSKMDSTQDGGPTTLSSFLFWLGHMALQTPTSCAVQRDYLVGMNSGSTVCKTKLVQ